MIFVTVGTQNYKFNRLFSYLENIDDEDIVIQSGINKIKKKDNYTIYKYMSSIDMKHYIDKCNILITHAGPDNIFYALSKNKKVIVVPRTSKYRECIGNHQIIFSQYLKDNNYCYVAFNKEEFMNALNSNKKLNKYMSNTDNFINNVKIQIDRLLNDNEKK